MDARQAFYQFTLGLINLVVDSGLWTIIGPFVILILFVRFLRWANATARDESDFESMQSETADLRRAIAQRRIRGGPRP